ncbi:MAG: hypothetical protein Q7U36_02175 [bacterium]|nr:hypothetical protein [bacterium]
MNTHIKTWLGTAIIIIIAITAGMFVWKVYEMNNASVSTPQTIQTTKQRAGEDFHSQPIDPFAVYCVQRNGALYFKNNTRYCKFIDNSECEEISYMNGECQDIANWQTYRNEKYGFEIKYPNWWEANGLVLKNLDRPSKGTGDIDGDIFITIIDKAEFPWGLREYNKNLPLIDVLINTFGSQFNDREVNRENIVINGVQAIKVKVTTLTVPSWIDEEVIFEKNNKLVQISNGANYTSGFEQIISTFKFTN